MNPLVWPVFVGNLIIATAYVGIAFFITPRFRIATTTFQVRLCQGLALGFFFLCAMSHLDIAYHAYVDEPSWMFNPHFVIQHLVQGLAGWVFLLLAQRNLSIRIFRMNDEYDTAVRHFVEERLEEVAEEIQKKEHP